MSVIPPLGSTWLIALESLGNVPGPRFLDGHTHDGTVGLAQTTDPPFTGTLWAAMRIAPSALILRCLGETAGPGFLGFLDGRSQDGTVGLVKTTGPPFSGTRWMAKVGSSGDGSLTLQCLGDIAGPGFHGFLDGRTHDGTVGLAPNTQPPFTGTRWRSHFLGEIVILQCLGDVPGPRFLDGRTHNGTVGLAPTTADPFSGTLWQMREQVGITTLKSLGNAPGARRFLDGRTQDPSVVLSDTTDPPFTGTRWKKVGIAPGVIELMCLGEVPGPGFHGFLDGRTQDGTVGLAPTTNPPFTGTRWRVIPPNMVIGNTSPYNDDVLAVHAALLPTAEIVYFGGDEHDRGEHELTTLRCMGNVPGPGFRGFLDGHTQDGPVGLAPTTDPPFTGTRWARIEGRPGEIELMCWGDVPGPSFRGFLDGNTHDGTVGLIQPSATQPLPSGTRWRSHDAGDLVTLECLGDIPGPRFLDGRTHDETVGLATTTADPFTGTLWQMSDQGGFTTLRCLGNLPGPRFLDGRTHNGTVGLALTTDPPFTGTRWRKIEVAPGAIELQCLGEVAGPGFHGFLDGRTQDHTVGLAHTTDPPFSGTRWRLHFLGKLSTLECLGDIPGARFLDGHTQDGTVHLASTTADPFTGTLWQTTDHSNVDHTRLFSCETAQDRRIGSPATDVFCCGHSLLADGQLLVAGGTEQFWVDPAPGAEHEHHFPGLHDAWLFDPFTRAWTKIASMSSSGPLVIFRNPDSSGPPDPGGRWYPMLLTLGTGDVLALSGHPSSHDTRHNHHIPERFSPALGTWTLLAANPGFEAMNPPFMYPRLHLLPNGQVFCSTPLELGTPQSQLIDPASGARTPAGPAPPKDPDPTRGGQDNINWGTDYSQDGSSVLLPLLPPDYRPRVLRCGTQQPVWIDLQPLMNNPNARPSWIPTAPRQLLPVPRRYTNPNPRRYHLSAVLLPTGDVFVCGGCARFRDEGGAVLESELYRPPNGNSPDRWESLPAATVIRNYHSVALLLPDGRVWTAGSNHGGAQGRENLEPRIEILNPPYVGAPNRPQITSAAEVIAPGGARFTIETPQARSIARVAILRVASVTHSFSSDQRYVGLDFSATSDRQLSVAPPPNHNIAPPGHYLLFVLDQAGLPSEGRFVRVG